MLLYDGDEGFQFHGAPVLSAVGVGLHPSEHPEKGGVDASIWVAIGGLHLFEEFIIIDHSIECRPLASEEEHFPAWI